MKMKDSTKRAWKNIFKSLVNNEACIDAAKNDPWWIAIIMFFLGMFLPVIPIMSVQGKSYGASFLDTTNYGYEDSITDATIYLKENGYKFLIYDDPVAKKALKVTQNDVECLPTSEEDVTPICSVSNTYTGQIDFNVYWSLRGLNTSNNVSELVASIEDTVYIVGTNRTLKSYTENELEALGEYKTYLPTYLILYPTGIYSSVRVNNAVTASTTTPYGYNWVKVKDTFKNSNNDILEYVYNVKDVAPDIRDMNYVNGVFNNWKEVFNVSYKQFKNQSFWLTTALYCGIYAALMLFMGLMIFLLTRGKRNMFNYLKIWTCFRIESWASVAPGILGMILGFLFSNNAVMFFIVFLGLRTMWLSMKQLRPQY